MLDLLSYDNIELSDSDISKEKDGGDASDIVNILLGGGELFSLSEVVNETPVVELASASLQSNHCQCYFGLS